MLSCFNSKAQAVAWALRRTFATAEAVAGVQKISGFSANPRPHLWEAGAGYRHPANPRKWVNGMDRGAMPTAPWA